jgi:polygalacturonase
MKYLILAFSIALAIGTVAFAAETPTTHPSDGMPAIERPQIPDRTFSVKDFAAAGDGKTFDTATIQKAVNACHTAGGGVVLVPAGRYLIAPIHLYSSMNLHLDKDATLLITDDTSKFKLSEKSGFECCIVADDCTDLALTGQGTIDGQGAMWWQHYVAPKTLAPGATAPPHRPYMVRLDGINRLLVQGITFRNSPSFHLALGMCQNVTIEDAHFIAEAGSHNTDGIDPSGWNYLITRCTFDVYDDCIAIKPTHQIDKSKPSCMNFLITD